MSFHLVIWVLAQSTLDQRKNQILCINYDVKICPVYPANPRNQDPPSTESIVSTRFRILFQ